MIFHHRGAKDIDKSHAPGLFAVFHLQLAI